MRGFLFVFALLSATAAFAQERPADIRAGDVAGHAVHNFAIPRFGAFAYLAMDHEAVVSTLCVRPSPGMLGYARAHFRHLVDAYARVSFLRFGPLARDDRNERLMLWPDPRGIALRQVQAVLAEADESAADWQSLQQKSVALQGLPALEFALFGTGSEALADGDPQSFRCRYAHAVAGAIRSIAQQAAAEWRAPRGIAQRLIEPSALDADYRSTREVLEELVGAMSHGLEAVRDTQLLPFLGRDSGDPKSRSAPLWRSSSTVILTAGAMEGIAEFLDRTGIARAAGEDGAFIANAVAFEARNIARARAAVTRPMEEAVTDPAQLQGLRYLVILTQSMQALIGDQLSVALGLSVGFSSLDGD